MHHNLYSKAVIWGNIFYGRGLEYAEISHPEAGNPSNVNCLMQQSFDAIDNTRGKWCRLHYYSNAKLGRFAGDATVYHKDFAVAQLNYFFVVKLPSLLDFEPVNGIPVASLLARKAKVIPCRINATTTKWYENLWEIDCNDSLSMDTNVQFSALYNIYPTPIAVVRASASGEPLRRLQKDELNKKLLVYALRRSNECVLHKRSYLETFHPYHNTDNLLRVKRWMISSDDA